MVAVIHMHIDSDRVRGDAAATTHLPIHLGLPLSRHTYAVWCWAKRKIESTISLVLPCAKLRASLIHGRVPNSPATRHRSRNRLPRNEASRGVNKPPAIYRCLLRRLPPVTQHRHQCTKLSIIAPELPLPIALEPHISYSLQHAPLAPLGRIHDLPQLRFSCPFHLPYERQRQRPVTRTDTTHALHRPRLAVSDPPKPIRLLHANARWTMDRIAL